MDRMLKNLNPLFTDVTWGAGGSTSDLSMKLALRAHNTGHIGMYDIKLPLFYLNFHSFSGLLLTLLLCSKLTFNMH